MTREEALNIIREKRGDEAHDIAEKFEDKTLIDCAEQIKSGRSTLGERMAGAGVTVVSYG